MTNLKVKKFSKNQDIQKAVSQTTEEIKQLQLTITEQRNELEKIKFEKKEAIQKQVQSSADEINQLKKPVKHLERSLKI